MRVTGRSLLYVGGGLTGGVAILFDESVIDDSARQLANSIELPGVDIVTVEQKVRDLHAVAAARRAREVTGTVLRSSATTVEQPAPSLTPRPASPTSATSPSSANQHQPRDTASGKINNETSFSDRVIVEAVYA